MQISPIKRLILETMWRLDKPTKATEIAEEVGLGFPNVMMHIIGLVKMEYASAPERGLYVITEAGKRVLSEVHAEIGSPKIDHLQKPHVLEKRTVLGQRYMLESLVGKGTYGVVWKAQDKSLERTVAVKLLHGGVKDFEQLKTEGLALSGLMHKNILVVYDLDSDKHN
jgi:DNA-binding MarR family transcriptional regulator